MSYTVKITNNSPTNITASSRSGVSMPSIAPGVTRVLSLSSLEWTALAEGVLELSNVDGVTVSVSDGATKLFDAADEITLYVSGGGDDSNPGTEAQPMRTWKAVQAAALAAVGPSGLKTIHAKTIEDNQQFYFGSTSYNGPEDDFSFAALIGPSGRPFCNTPNWRFVGDTYTNSQIQQLGDARDIDPDAPQPQYSTLVLGPAEQPRTGVGFVITNFEDEDAFDDWYIANPPEITLNNTTGEYALNMGDIAAVPKTEDFRTATGSTTSWIVNMNITIENFALTGEDDNDTPDRPTVGLMCIVGPDTVDVDTPADQKMSVSGLKLRNCNLNGAGDGNKYAGIVTNTHGTVIEGVNTSDQVLLFHNVRDIQMYPGGNREGDDAVIALINYDDLAPSHGYVMSSTSNDANRLFDPDQGRSMMETTSLYIGGPAAKSSMRIREVISSAYGTVGLHGAANVVGDPRTSSYLDLYRLSNVEARVLNHTSSGNLSTERLSVQTLNKSGTGALDVMAVQTEGSATISAGAHNKIRSGVILGNFDVSDAGDVGEAVVVDLDNVNVMGDLTLSAANVTVNMRGCAVFGDITVGAGATLNIQAANLNRTVETPTGAGTINA